MSSLLGQRSFPRWAFLRAVREPLLEPPTSFTCSLLFLRAVSRNANLFHFITKYYFFLERFLCQRSGFFRGGESERSSQTTSTASIGEGEGVGLCVGGYIRIYLSEARSRPYHQRSSQVNSSCSMFSISTRLTRFCTVPTSRIQD